MTQTVNTDVTVGGSPVDPEVAATTPHTSPSEPPWVVCTGCRTMLYAKRLARNLYVCPECGLHLPLTAAQRLALLLDGGSMSPLPYEVSGGDPLDFVDTLPYRERLRRAQETTGMAEAVVICRGSIERQPVIVAAMDFRFLGGSLNTAVGELIAEAASVALDERIPLLLVSASGGARMQEGALSLLQMAKTCQALAELDRAGVLTISLVTDPTFGGVAASFATACDVIIAEPGARMGFAGSRVIEQTIRQKLPDGFQTAEFLFEHGLVDMIRPRSAHRRTIGRLLAIGSGGRPEPQPSAGRWDEYVVSDWAQLPTCPAWEVVQQARRLDRPTTLDYVHRMLSDFEELHGDRSGSDCPAVVGGVGRLDGLPVLVIGHQKGHTRRELLARNFGMPSPAGNRKAARLMRLAAKLRLPVVTLVDTPGAHPGVEAEEQGQAAAIAQNLVLMAGLPVPIVTVVTGEGGSGGALALAAADRVFMLGDAIYSVISPEGCASILWRDAAMAPRAAEALKLDARSLLRLGVVDGVIPEPPGGASAAPAEAAEGVRAAVSGALRELLGLDPDTLLALRRKRFRGFGAGTPAPEASGDQW